MKDQRVAYFRSALEALVDSLSATTRLSRWEESAESSPEPLRQSAAKLVERLGVANRLAADKFAGPPHIVAALTGLSGVMKRLDVAYVQYQRRITTTPAEQGDATQAFEAEIEEVKTAAQDW